MNMLTSVILLIIAVGFAILISIVISTIYCASHSNQSITEAVSLCAVKSYEQLKEDVDFLPDLNSFKKTSNSKNE